MSKKFFPLLQKYNVQTIQVINDIPYAELPDIDKPGIYNLLTNELIPKTSRGTSFQADSTDIWFCRFPNKYLTQLNPKTEKLTSHIPVSHTQNLDKIFIYKQTVALILHGKNLVQFMDGREDQFYAPSFTSFSASLENSFVILNFVFCDNGYIEYDTENHFFQAKEYEKDIEPIIVKLSQGNIIGQVFYDENGNIMLEEMQQIAIQFDLEFWWQEQVENVFFDVFDSLINEEVVYKCTKSIIRNIMQKGQDRVKQAIENCAENSLSKTHSQSSIQSLKSVQKDFDKIVENSDSASILREEDEIIEIKTLDQDILSPIIQKMTLNEMYVKNLEKIRNFDLQGAVSKIEQTGVDISTGADLLFQQMISYLQK